MNWHDIREYIDERNGSELDTDMNRLETLPHGVAPMTRRETLFVAAGVALPAMLSERQTARRNIARTMEGVPEIDGPAFQSYDAWVDVYVKKIELDFLPRMKEISGRMKKMRTNAERAPLQDELWGIADAVARQMGGLRIPAMERVLSPQAKYGLAQIFTGHFKEILESVCKRYPFLMAGGKVRADLAVDYMQVLTRLPFNIKNTATLDRLEHAEFIIPDREQVWKSLARLCNELDIEVDPTPFGYKDDLKDGQPEAIDLVEAGPLWRITYSHTNQGVEYHGEVVKNEFGTKWHFSPENGPPGPSRPVHGSYYPNKVLVRNPLYDQPPQARDFTDNLLPLYDRKTDQILVRCPETGRLCFREPTEKERSDFMYDLEWEEWKFVLPMQEWSLRQK